MAVLAPRVTVLAVPAHLELVVDDIPLKLRKRDSGYQVLRECRPIEYFRRLQAARARKQSPSRKPDSSRSG